MLHSSRSRIAVRLPSLQALSAEEARRMAAYVRRRGHGGEACMKDVAIQEGRREALRPTVLQLEKVSRTEMDGEWMAKGGSAP